MFSMTTSRDVLAEITRHRMASFCVSGDTVVSYDGKTKGATIADLYNKDKQYQHLTKIRSVNETDNEIILNSVVNVFYNGIQPTFCIKTTDGYSVRATASHEFLTDDGWKKLSELSINDRIYTNGIDAYKSKEWLDHKYNIENLSQREIADLCGVSHHTIRAWIRRFGLQKELGSWCIGKAPANKGKTKYNYPPMIITSVKQIERWKDPSLVGHVGKNKPPVEEVYGLKNTNGNGYDKVHDFYTRSYKCQICGESSKTTEVHHIDRNPKNFTPDNLVELCRACHKRIHKGASVKAVKPSFIESIEFYGDEPVYDIEMKAPYHNYIANGFVVHNCVESQRYVNESKDEGGIKFIRPLFYKPFDVSYNYSAHDHEYEASRLWEESMELAEYFYNAMIAIGIKNQDARKVLPNSTACTIMMDVNLRELLHIYNLRSSPAAYPEIRELMRLLKIEVDKVLPGFLPENEKE